MYIILSLTCAIVMAEVCTWSVVRAAFFNRHRLSHPPLRFCFLLETTCRISSTYQMGFSELFHGAFKEASFLAASDDGQLYITPLHLTKHLLFFISFLIFPFCTTLLFALHTSQHVVLSYKAWSMPRLFCHRTHPFSFVTLSQTPNNGWNDLAYGSWMSCRSARWEAGHRRGVHASCGCDLSTLSGVQLLDLKFLAWLRLLL